LVYSSTRKGGELNMPVDLKRDSDAMLTSDQIAGAKAISDIMSKWLPPMPQPTVVAQAEEKPEPVVPTPVTQTSSG
jgi:hypothetical protein